MLSVSMPRDDIVSLPSAVERERGAPRAEPDDTDSRTNFSGGDHML
jgi:hypothetical protein